MKGLNYNIFSKHDLEVKNYGIKNKTGFPNVMKGIPMDLKINQACKERFFYFPFWEILQ